MMLLVSGINFYRPADFPTFGPCVDRSLNWRQYLAAVLGRRSVIRTWTIALNKATLPAWCEAARGMGTRYNKVEIPSSA